MTYTIVTNYFFMWTLSTPFISIYQGFIAPYVEWWTCMLFAVVTIDVRLVLKVPISLHATRVTNFKLYKDSRIQIALLKPYIIHVIHRN